MTALSERIASAADIDEGTAQQAIGFILAFMREESDDPAVAEMIGKTPGAAEASASVGEVEFGGAGIMGLGAKLMGLGLDMGQIRSVAEELVADARVQAGDETVNQAIASVPALAQFV